MSLFEKISGIPRQNSVALNPAEAFAGIALIAVAADGYLADAEAQVLSSTLRRMHLFRSHSGDVIRGMLDRLLRILQQQGVKVLFDAAIQSLPTDLYETTFAIVTDLVLADGAISTEEEQLLNDLYRVLELSEEMAIQIIDVMLIKNRG
ncbi:MAG: tellurite resistance TerB family protein [Cyanobacteriota bacterium]|nr:tellurite resistance TerB family protein [Cyanobacteriota bacterium]